MNDLQSFDFSSLKKMTVDSLILMCQGYVKQYLSESDAIRFEDAYKNSEYGEVKHILEETLKKVNGKTKKSEFQKVKQIVLSEFPGAENLFESSDENGGGKNDNMGTGSGLVAVIIITAILVIAIVGTVFYLKGKSKTVGEVLKENKSNSMPKYTEKDKDMILLIQELTEIYENTDQYLKN